jgi:hypothetical protein
MSLPIEMRRDTPYPTEATAAYPPAPSLEGGGDGRSGSGLLTAMPWRLLQAFQCLHTVAAPGGGNGLAYPPAPSL